MRGLAGFLVGAVLLGAAGCATGPQDRLPDTVQGTTMREQGVRDELWEKQYKERERKARERMEKPSAPGISD